MFLEARYRILRRESSLVKEGLFLVIFRNCRLSPSMIFVVYMIFLISGGSTNDSRFLLSGIYPNIYQNRRLTDLLSGGIQRRIAPIYLLFIYHNSTELISIFVMFIPSHL